MVVGWTPTSLAMRRQLQCVASAGFSSRVLRTISASSSGVILRGRPERGRSSSSSSTPPASYRSSHCVTVGLDTPTSRQIADPDRPSAEQRTILALSTTRCGVVRLFTNRSKRLRSPRRNRILRTGSHMRGIYRMYLLGKRFLLHYTRLQPGGLIVSADPTLLRVDMGTGGGLIPLPQWAIDIWEIGRQLGVCAAGNSDRYL